MANKSLFSTSFKTVELLRTDSTTVEQTLAIASKFAQEKLQANDVVCLIGDLGAGKTHFVKGVAEAFGASGSDVNSPTYTLINEYETAIPIFHFDLYRLKNEQEVLDIGFEEYLYSNGICIIEWPTLVTEMLPTPFWLVQITSHSKAKRHIQISQCTH